MINRLMAVAVVVSLSSLNAAEPSQVVSKDGLKAYLKDDGWRKSIVAGQKKRVAELERELRIARARKSKDIKTLEEQLAEAKSPLRVAYLPIHSLKPNMVGLIACKPFADVEAYDGIGLHVVSVVDGQNVIVRASPRGSPEVILWLSNVDTTGFADDAFISTEGKWYEVAGSKSYESALGAKKTVFHIRPFDIREFLNR